jgi:hypothetical protein
MFRTISDEAAVRRSRLPSLSGDQAMADEAASSLECWPAAGGGLLLGTFLAPLSSDTLPCKAGKTLFLRIDTQSQPTAIVPYIRLEPQVVRRAANVIAADLGVHSDGVAIDNRVSGSASLSERRITDLCPICELGFAIMGAVARTLLTKAAADIWKTTPGGCTAVNGMVIAGDAQHKASYADLAPDAALLPLPVAVNLSSGRRVALRADGPRSIKIHRPWIGKDDASNRHKRSGSWAKTGPSSLALRRARAPA